MNPQQAKLAYESYQPPPTPTPAQVEAFLETFGYSRTEEAEGWVVVLRGDLDYISIPQKVQAPDFRRAMWGCVNEICFELGEYRVPTEGLFALLSQIDVTSRS